jgi:phage terminase large subunit-like protein
MAAIDAPILHVGVDIGYRRDTSAVVAMYRHPEWNQHCLFCHKAWTPPVHIPNVTAYVRLLLSKERVAGVWFDPHQWAAEAQHLAGEGYDHQLQEVQQSGSFMVAIGNNLSNLMQRGNFLLYKNAEVRNHFSWCAAKATERGYRIVKQAQSKPIDIVVAMAMAAWGSSQDLSHMTHPTYDRSVHSVGVLDLA